MADFCSLCGSTDPADLGQAIGICLDKDACHRRQYARLRDRADEATARAESAEAALAAIRKRCRVEQGSWIRIPAILDIAGEVEGEVR